MLLNISNDYSVETKETLRKVWKDLLAHLAKDQDPKKIVSFLSKCAVIGIDEKEQIVRLGIPNDFVLQQVKKFFLKPLATSIQASFNPAYKIELTTYSDLQS
jgi:hypothetical protein